MKLSYRALAIFATTAVLLGGSAFAQTPHSVFAPAPFEILPRNASMLRLAARAQGTITTSRDNDIVHATALFPDGGNTSRSTLPDSQHPQAGEVAA